MAQASLQRVNQPLNVFIQKVCSFVSIWQHSDLFLTRPSELSGGKFRTLQSRCHWAARLNRFISTVT
jgi:hypothetical protein